MTVRMEQNIHTYYGLSTDTKPTSVLIGSKFYAHDIDVWYKTYDGTNWVPTEINSIVIPKTFDLQQAANTYDLYTATGGTVYVTSLAFTLPNVNCADDINITSISIQNDMATVVVLLSATAGAKANLTANASFTYNTPFALTVGKKIQITIAGGAADAATVCTVNCLYKSVSSGAYLA